MKKSDELKQTVDVLRKEVNDLQAQEQMDAAAAKAKELTDAVHEYQTAKALEDAELTNFMRGGAQPATSVDKVEAARMRNRIFNKLVLGHPLNDAEREFQNAAGTPGQVEATPGKGGYLVPEEQMAGIREYRRAYVSLKDYCNVQTAQSNAGKMPSIGTESGTLTAFEELNEIKKSDIDFGQIKYEIKDYGDIIPVSNSLLQDADVDLMGIIGKRYVRKSVNTENSIILPLFTGKTATTITDWKGITKCLNVTLDPAISAGAKIVTNQDGLEWLDELVDAQGRPLLTASLADPTKSVFRGREVIVIPNSTLSLTNKIPFYVGSVSDAVAFYERKGIEVAVSGEAGFTQNATLIRAIQRFDAESDDAAAIAALNVTTA